MKKSLFFFFSWKLVWLGSASGGSVLRGVPYDLMSLADHFPQAAARCPFEADYLPFSAAVFTVE